MDRAREIIKTFKLGRQAVGPLQKLRFPVLCNTQNSFKVSIKDPKNQIILGESEITLKPGFHWVEQRFNSPIFPESKSVDLEIHFTSQSQFIHLYFDSQRFYSRTRVNQKIDSAFGEMVIELISSYEDSKFSK